MSNFATPPQLVEEVSYRDTSEMPAFARKWRDEHLGQWFTVPKLSGFCLLVKRAVYDRIGGLDERFGLGFFDDDDLTERARRAGFELAVAHDLFVHHFGSRTFAGNGVDARKVLDEYARRFADKWGLPTVNGISVTLRPWSDGSGAHARRDDLTRSSSSTPAAPTGRSRSPARSGPRCSSLRGSIVLPRRATRLCHMRPVIMPSGSMPTTWSSRTSERSCGRCWEASQARRPPWSAAA